MHSLRVQWQQHAAAARERARRTGGWFPTSCCPDNAATTPTSNLASAAGNELSPNDGLPTLHWLVDHADLVATPALPLRQGEAATILGVAHALLRYGADAGLAPPTRIGRASPGRPPSPDWSLPRNWTHTSVRCPGSAALFAYTRMLCGSDTVKPDVRDPTALRRHGVDLPSDNAAAGLIAVACAAHELGTTS